MTILYLTTKIPPLRKLQEFKKILFNTLRSELPWKAKANEREDDSLG
jgi:hypothetical protein